MTPDTLRAAIADLRQYVNVLPRIDSAAGDITGQFQRLRRACHHLAAHLRKEHGARITEKPDSSRIVMCGITATSTGGLHGAYQNWLAAAERRLGEGET